MNLFCHLLKLCYQKEYNGTFTFFNIEYDLSIGFKKIDMIAWWNNQWATNKFLVHVNLGF